jgi:hypothetical protein
MGRARPVRHRGKWRIRWLDHTGRRCSEVYECYEEADTALLRHKVEVAAIKSGRRAPIQRGKTHSELFDYWLSVRASRKRSGRDDRSIIERHLRPLLGGLPMGGLTVADVDAYVASRSHLSPKTVNNHLTLLTTMLNLAVELGWLGRAPRIKKLKAPVCGPGYCYLRTQTEIERFLEATKAQAERPVAYEQQAAPVHCRLCACTLGLKVLHAQRSNKADRCCVKNAPRSHARRADHRRPGNPFNDGFASNAASLRPNSAGRLEATVKGSRRLNGARTTDFSARSNISMLKVFPMPD